MSWIRDLIVEGVALADSIIDDGGQYETVTQLAWRGQQTDGAPDYLAIVRKAMVIKRQRLVQIEGGRMIQSQHTLYFFSPLTDTTVTDPARYKRTNPIDPQDKFILPDGTVGTVIPVDGMYDPLIHRSYYQQVVLGL